MIYIKGENGLTVIILDPRHLALLKEGKSITTPDNTIMLLYQPDLEWTSNRFRDAYQGDNPASISDVVAEGMKRPIKITSEPIEHGYLHIGPTKETKQ